MAPCGQGGAVPCAVYGSMATRPARHIAPALPDGPNGHVGGAIFLIDHKASPPSAARGAATDCRMSGATGPSGLAGSAALGRVRVWRVPDRTARVRARVIPRRTGRGSRRTRDRAAATTASGTSGETGPEAVPEPRLRAARSKVRSVGTGNLPCAGSRNCGMAPNPAQGKRREKPICDTGQPLQNGAGRPFNPGSGPDD